MIDRLTNRLSLEQVQELLSSALPTEKEYIESHAVQLARQLLATMQREALYHEACGYAIRNFERLGFHDRAETMERIMQRNEVSDV